MFNLVSVNNLLGKYFECSRLFELVCSYSDHFEGTYLQKDPCWIFFYCFFLLQQKKKTQKTSCIAMSLQFVLCCDQCERPCPCCWCTDCPFLPVFSTLLLPGPYLTSLLLRNSHSLVWLYTTSSRLLSYTLLIFVFSKYLSSFNTFPVTLPKYSSIHDLGIP